MIWKRMWGSFREYGGVRKGVWKCIFSWIWSVLVVIERGSESAFSHEFSVFWGCKKRGLKVYFPVHLPICVPQKKQSKMSQNLLFISTSHVSEYLFQRYVAVPYWWLCFQGWRYEDHTFLVPKYKSLCLEFEINIINHHHLLSWGNYYHTRIQIRARVNA